VSERNILRITDWPCKDDDDELTGERRLRKNKEQLQELYQLVRLGRPRPRWEDRVEEDIEKARSGMDRKELALDRKKCGGRSAGRYGV